MRYRIRSTLWINGGNTLEDLRPACYNCVAPNKTAEIVNYMKTRAEASDAAVFREAEI